MTNTTTTRPPPRHDVTTALHSDGHHYATCNCRWHSLPVPNHHAAMVAAGQHLQSQTTGESNLWKIIVGIGLLFVVGFVGAMASQGEDVMSPIIGMLILGLGLAAYLLPTLIAGSRKHHNIGAIAVVNIFLGWTFIGWVVALAMAASAVKE